jgi:hypothetical protein
VPGQPGRAHSGFLPALWGLTAKRPRRLAGDQDSEEVRQWLEETYPGSGPQPKVRRSTGATRCAWWRASIRAGAMPAKGSRAPWRVGPVYPRTCDLDHEQPGASPLQDLHEHDNRCSVCCCFQCVIQ